jgi:RecG-like helicase
MKRTPLSKKLDRQLLHTTDERIDLLAEIGIHTVYDLLEFYPRTHEDFTVPTNLAELRADEKNLLCGNVHQSVERNRKATDETY